MYLSQHALQKVGAFDEKFEIFGFEHCDWSRRFNDGKHGNYPMLHYTEQYLHSEDYSNPNHKSSISDDEKKQHVRNNWDKFFKEPIKEIYIPL